METLILTKEEAKAVKTDLIEFVHRVAHNESASAAELAALPEVLKVLNMGVKMREDYCSGVTA